MSTCLKHVAKREHFHLPDPARDAILGTSQGNLRKAMLVFEAMKMQRPDLTGDLEVAKPDWETYCAKVADAILQEQSAQRLLEVRGKIYELLSHCIPPTMVMKVSLPQRAEMDLTADYRRETGRPSGRAIEASDCALGGVLCE